MLFAETCYILRNCFIFDVKFILMTVCISWHDPVNLEPFKAPVVCTFLQCHIINQWKYCSSSFDQSEAGKLSAALQ